MRCSLEWDGRDDAGNVLPEGDYRPRVHLQRDRSTITFPNDMRIDVTAPVIEAMTVAPRVISPDGDGRADRVVVRYRLDDDARGVLFVNGRRHTLTLFARPEGAIVWNGKQDGAAVRPGPYTLALSARDAAGNVATPRKRALVQVRYIALGRDRITVDAGRRFAVRVSADARRVRWQLGRRTGLARPGTLVLRAPVQKGQYTLVVSARGHEARAAVFVVEPASERPR